MTTSDPVFEKYVSIAIQTVLQRNRNLIHLLMDTDKYMPLVKDLSKEIFDTAKVYRQITETTIEEMARDQQAACDK
ncbi:MAG TPA: hypothetical protein VGE40_00155 [Bacilli bacterium]